MWRTYIYMYMFSHVWQLCMVVTDFDCVCVARGRNESDVSACGCSTPLNTSRSGIITCNTLSRRQCGLGIGTKYLRCYCKGSSWINNTHPHRQTLRSADLTIALKCSLHRSGVNNSPLRARHHHHSHRRWTYSALQMQIFCHFHIPAASHV